jgi:CheY-like chemotaxis protein
MVRERLAANQRQVHIIPLLYTDYTLLLLHIYTSILKINVEFTFYPHTWQKKEMIMQMNPKKTEEEFSYHLKKTKRPHELQHMDMSRKQALVVEDNAAVCKFLAIALESIGFEVQTAENGQVAYDLFLKNRCDLVITDLQMPVMNGLSLIRKLKNKAPETPIILISGEFPGDISENGCHTAIAGFLHKPFSLNELHRTVLNAVSRARSRVAPSI